MHTREAGVICYMYILSLFIFHVFVHVVDYHRNACTISSVKLLCGTVTYMYIHVHALVLAMIDILERANLMYCSAWVDGEPERLIYPTDSRGRLCGVHDDVKSVHYCTYPCSTHTYMYMRRKALHNNIQ